MNYGIDLFSLTCNQFKITEQSTGESLKNFEIKGKDLIIADRAYGTITSIKHCLKSGGVWLNGKMFLALLIEKYPGDIDFPLPNIRTESEYMERNEIGVLFDLYDVTSR